MARDSADRLEPDDILHAYRLGYFPMARAREDIDVVWVLPDMRGVLPLDEARAPRRLLKFLRKAPFEVRVNTAFRDVMLACAAPGPGREDTWINDAIFEAYCALHDRGDAHSVECYRDGALVGGLYGVALGALFCGESMFSRADNASKIAFAYLIALLRSGGFALLDTQFQTDHLAQFGVREWPSDTYQTVINGLTGLPAQFPASASSVSASSVSAIFVSQVMTQTS